MGVRLRRGRQTERGEGKGRESAAEGTGRIGEGASGGGKEEGRGREGRNRREVKEARALAVMVEVVAVRM